MRILKVAAIVIGAVVVIGFGFIASGAFNVAADSPHWRATQWLLETARERSISVRAGGMTVPPLDDPKLIAMGAEHYAEMCTGCHLAPGVEESELRRGLYPQPPNLIEHGRERDPQETFWIIKHGIKMTAMPAWGTMHDDHSIWAMVAFLRKLPELTPEAYNALNAENEGEHSHHEHSEEHDADDMPQAMGAMADDHVAEPVAVVDQFFGALAAGNAKAASALLDPAVLIYESGGVERSRSEYAAEHLGADAAFLKAAKHKLLSRKGDAVGELAWVAPEARLTAPGAKPTDIVTTETVILRKEPAGWRIVHIHWSSRQASH